MEYYTRLSTKRCSLSEVVQAANHTMKLMPPVYSPAEAGYPLNDFPASQVKRTRITRTFSDATSARLPSSSGEVRRY